MTDVDDSPTLSVGFAIDTGNAVEALRQIDRAMHATAGGLISDATRIEQATRQMVKADGAVAGFAATANASSRAAYSIARDRAQIEKTGERLVAQLEKQNATFGMTRQEIAAARIEAAAFAAQEKGLTELAARLRTEQTLLNQKLGTSAAQHDLVARSAGKSGFAVRQFALQLPDITQGLLTGQKPFQVFIQQGGQLAQVAQMGQGGVRGFAKELGLAALRFAPLGVAAAAAAGGFALFVRWINEGVKNDQLTRDLGKITGGANATRAELYKLKDETISWGDVTSATFRIVGNDVKTSFLGDMKGMSRGTKDVLDDLTGYAKKSLAGIHAGLSGTRSYLGELEKGGVTGLFKALTGQGDATLLDRTFGKAFREADAYLTKLGGRIRTQAVTNARERLAEKIGFNTPRAASSGVDKHAKELRDAERAAKELESSYEGLQGRFDTAGAAARQFSKDLADIAKLQRAGKIDQDTADVWGFQAARDAAAKVAATVQEVTLQVEDIPKVTELNFEVTGLDKLLGTTLNPFDVIARDARDAANSISSSFAGAGRSLANMIDVLGDYGAQQDRIDKLGLTREQAMSESRKLALNTTIAATGAAKGLFAENSRGYQAMEAAERALMAVQLVKTGIDVAGGAARMFASLGPLAFPAVGAMVAVMAGLGFSGGVRGVQTPSNTGTGTVLGSGTAQSESLKRSLDGLREVSTVTSVYAREQLAALRSIDSQIGGVAAVVARGGDLDATKGIDTSFKTNAVGSVLKAIVPIFGGALASLFGSKTTITGSGLYAGAQSLGSILGGGFDASTYADTEKVKKFLGITTGRSRSTQYGAIDPALEGQFTMILRGFNDAIAAAAAPLGQSTDAIQSRLNGFVVNLGKIDLTGLSGEEIQSKLENVFGAAADRMAEAAFPGLTRFQKVGEGAFQTLTRVASTVEAVTGSLDQLGLGARKLSLDAKIALADQFDSVGDLVSAADAFFTAYYTPAEQNAAKLSQLNSVFLSLGVSTPATIAAFRQLVEAQDLATDAGRSTYATLLQLAPAFADLQKAMTSAKSAADVLAEREDLERRLLELAGDTAAIRALDLAKLDASNRLLQQQVWGIEDAQAATKAAGELRDAWASVGKSILDEVDRIRGVTDDASSGGFAAAMGRFNAATDAARAADQDAAKSLPALSQALLKLAGESATSRQELDRVSAATADSLSDTARMIAAMTGANTSPAAILTAAGAQAAAAPISTTANQADAIEALRQEIADMRREMVAGIATTATNTGALVRRFDDVTAQSGGDAISTVQAA